MGMIAFVDTKREALKLKKKQKFHTNLKIRPVTAGMGKIAYYELVGKPKKILRSTKIRKGQKITTFFVMHKGRKARLSTEIRRVK